MLKKRISPALLLAATVLAGCSSMPNQNILLAEARSDYTAAQNSPGVVQLAPNELKDAGVALGRANAAFAEHKDDENINKLASLAKQKIAATLEIAKRKAAEKVAANAGKEREQRRLKHKTAEADKANAELAIVPAGKQHVQLHPEKRTTDVDKAQKQTSIAQKQVETAQAQVADAQLIAAEAEERARQLAFILDEMAAQETERGILITLGDVLFNVDQSQLKPEGMHNLQKLSDFMKQYPLRTVLIEGYTDDTGSPAHNLDLSNRRTEAVRVALESLGISRDRSSTHSYGEAYPVVRNDTAENRQMNRRVEITLSGDNGRVAPR